MKELGGLGPRDKSEEWWGEVVRGSGMSRAAPRRGVGGRWRANGASHDFSGVEMLHGRFQSFPAP